MNFDYTSLSISLSKSALKNQGMSLRVERSETKQSQGIEVCLHSFTWFGLFVPTYLSPNFMFKKLLSITFLAILLWVSLLSDMAFSGLTESRINNLESRFYRLESQVNRIETQLSRAGVSKLKVPNNPSLSQRRPSRLSQSNRDKMFDRLATLVIELKEDIKDLQKRVSQLEKANNY